MEGTPDRVHRKESMFLGTHVKIPEVLKTNGHRVQEELGWKLHRLHIHRIPGTVRDMGGVCLSEDSSEGSTANRLPCVP